MEFIWSKEKEELFKFDSDILVSASAGTGKTTALVELYMRLLEGKTDIKGRVMPENILAMTFTNKATAEMRERIISSISERDIDIDGQTIYLNSNIYTFHGFCQSMLREYSFEAGLSSEFQIINEIEKQKILHATIYKYLVREIKADNKEVKQFLGSMSFKEYLETVKHVLDKLSGNRPADIDEQQLTSWVNEEILIQVARYADIVDQWKQIIAETKTGKEKFWIYAQNVLEFWKNHYPGLNGEKLLDKNEILQFVDQWLQFENSQSVSASGRYKGLLAEMKDLHASVGLFITQTKAIADMARFTNIIREIMVEFSVAKQKNDLLDFDDLEQYCISLLENNDEVREDIQQRFQVILVDEFQDTNKTQVRLLNLIKRSEALVKKTGLPQTRCLFVGDRKQSIYKFRGAEVEVFRGIENDMLHGSDTGKRIHFKENYRSVPVLLDVFNKLSDSVMVNGSGQDFDVNYNNEDNLLSGFDDQSVGDVFPVELILVNEQLNADETAKAEADYIAGLIESYCSGKSGLKIKNKQGEYVTPDYDDIAILLRARSKQQIFEQALREHGIPVVIGKGDGFFDRQEVCDIENLLKFFYQPLDEIARYAVLRSPAVLISDLSLVSLSMIAEKNWLMENFTRPNWAPLLKRIPSEEQERFLLFTDVVSNLYKRKSYLLVSEVIEELVSSLHIKIIEQNGHDGTRKVANIDKFLDIVRGWEAGDHAFNIVNLKEHLKIARENSSVKESEAEFIAAKSSVSLMTMHASKGLEFPIVILPQLHYVPNSDGSKVKITVDSDNRIIKQHFNEDDQEWENTYLWKQKGETDTNKGRAESQRLFYVAITRARNHLVLSGQCSFSKKDKNVNSKGSDSSKWMDWVAAHFERANKEKLYLQFEQLLSPVNIDDNLLHFSDLPIQGNKELQAESWAEKYLEYFAVDPSGSKDNEKLQIADFVKEDDSEKQTVSFDYLVRRFNELQQQNYEPELIGTFSVSNLRDLSMCERKYQLKHLLDKSTLLWMENSNEMSGLADIEDNQTSQGIMVHKYFELLDQDEQVSLESWQEFLQEYNLDAEEQWAREAGEKIVRAGRVPDTAREKPLFVFKEIPFIARLNLPSGNIIRVKGVIDVLRYFEDSGFEIIDYKYAHYQSYKQAGYEFQIQLYAEVIRQAFAYASVYERSWIGYLKDNQVYREVMLDDVSRRNFLQKLDELIKKAKMLDSKKEIDWEKESLSGCDNTDCQFCSICNK